MTEKTSPYIFPFRPFRRLDVPTPNVLFGESKLYQLADLEPLLERFAPRLELPDAETLEERILAIFTLPEVLFGEAGFITSRKQEWLPKLRTLIAAKRPIEFTILGFPYKMPVPLKTNRQCADLGEVVSLKRLHAIGEAISGAYSPGAIIHVFTEGVFGEFNGLERSWSDRYFSSLEHQVASFGLDRHLRLHDLNAVVDANDGFRAVWKKCTEQIRARRDAGDPTTLQAIYDALPVRFHNLANPGVSEEELRKAYLNDPSATELRNSIQRRAEEGVLTYRAFLEARDKVELLKPYAPDALGMTVSPRPGRLGVRPLPAPTEILPYHGVPVISADQTSMRVEYLWDLLRSGGSLTPARLAGDLEDKPFFYLEG